MIILQTTILPRLPLFDNFYDLPALFVIYLSVYRPARESLLVVIFLGFIMDSLSSTPFMLYITAYLWLFLSVRGITKILRLEGTFRLPFIVASGVLIENLIFLIAVSIIDSGFNLSLTILRSIAIQILWVICTGALFLVALNYCHRGLDIMINQYIIQKKGVSKNSLID
jgi:rod shape-determining protein MreD